MTIIDKEKNSWIVWNKININEFLYFYYKNVYKTAEGIEIFRGQYGEEFVNDKLLGIDIKTQVVKFLDFVKG